MKQRKRCLDSCSPSSWEAEAKGLSWVQVQPGLQMRFCLIKQKCRHRLMNWNFAIAPCAQVASIPADCSPHSSLSPEDKDASCIFPKFLSESLLNFLHMKFAFYLVLSEWNVRQFQIHKEECILLWRLHKPCCCNYEKSQYITLNIKQCPLVSVRLRAKQIKLLPWTVQKATFDHKSPYIYGNYNIHILKWLFEVKQDHIKIILISYDFEFEFILEYMFFQWFLLL